MRMLLGAACVLLAWTPGREVKADEEVQGEDSDADEPIENWKVLKPEERAGVPASEWVYRWIKMSKSRNRMPSLHAP